jgi:hypothetical protein
MSDAEADGMRIPPERFAVGAVATGIPARMQPKTRANVANAVETHLRDGGGTCIVLDVSSEGSSRIRMVSSP